jgi:hypothetical protein
VIFERHKMRLEDVITITMGTPQFRIKESMLDSAPTYFFYGQQELESDLIGIELGGEEARTISTLDELSLIKEGDILFSLISGRATIVRQIHQGYLYTQNYAKLIPEEGIDGNYLVYLLNESDYIKKQWIKELQGSATLKHTVKQLRQLQLPKLHSYEKQKIIGNIYFKQLRLHALKERVAELEKVLIIEKLKEVDR